MVIKNFRIVFDRLNIMKSAEEGSRSSEVSISGSSMQGELKAMVNMFTEMNKRVNKMEVTLGNLFKVSEMFKNNQVYFNFF